MADYVNCLIVDDERVAREILEQHLGKMSSLRVVQSCKNVPEAFDALQQHRVDLIFLDINLPEVSGLSFAKSVNHDVKIIFTTAYREYAIDGFDLQAVDYLLKPVSFERLMKAVQKFQKEKEAKPGAIVSGESKPEEAFIFVRAERKMVKVNFADILFVEALSDYVKICMDGSTILTRDTISNIEARLPTDQFVRIHRSYIVSLQSIDAYTHEDVVVQNKELPIGRSYKEHLLFRLNR